MSEHSKRSVYRYHLPRFIMFFAVSALAIIIAVGMVLRMILDSIEAGRIDILDLILAPPLFVLMFGFGALIALTMLVVRLVVTPEGLHYHILAYHAYAPWDRVSALGESTHPYQGRADELLLLNPEVHLRGWTRHAKWHIEPHPDWMLVPVSHFMVNWQQRKLGRELREYAPHLFAPDARRFQVTPD